MRSHIFYSLLGLSLLGELSIASPLDLPGQVKQSFAARKAGEGEIKCNNAKAEKYSLRDDIIDKVEHEFCDMAQKQGHPDTNSRSITRKYFTGTPSELSITIDWEPGLDFKPNAGECKRIMREITDSCDTDSGRYKGGGEKSAGKSNKVKYQWRPEAERKSWAGCEYYSRTGYDDYTVWGSGWTGDTIDQLRKRVKGAGMSNREWRIEEINPHEAEDGREWTAEFDTIIWAQGRVEGAIEDKIPMKFDVACHKM